MTQWDERFESFAVWNHLDRIESGLSQADALAQKQEDPEALEAVKRLEAVTDFVRRKLESMDPFLAPKETLNNLAKQCQKTEQHIQKYIETEAPDHITTAGGDRNGVYWGDRMVQFASRLPGTETSQDMHDVQERLKSFRRSAGQQMRRMTEEAQEARRQAEEVISEAEEQVQEFKDSVLGDLGTVEEQAEEKQQEIASQARQRLNELESEINNQKERVSDALSRWENNFTTSQEERKEEFKSQLDNANTRLERLIEELRSEGRTFLNEMEKDRKSVEKLMGVIGASGRARGFEKQADYERKLSYIFRGLAIAAMLGIVGVGAWLARETVVTETLSWPPITAKITLMGAIGILAAYAVRQGRKHLNRAQLNRQLQLELTSIDPYMSGLPEQKQQEIKERMVDRWFGNLPSTSSSEPNEQARESIVQDILQMIRDGMRRGDV